MYIRYLHKIFTLFVFDTVQECIYNIFYKACDVTVMFSLL
jgi:hypothetical protein